MHTARLEGEAELAVSRAQASGADALVEQLKVLIARYKREKFGQSAERARQLLDQLEYQLEELKATSTEAGGTQGHVPVRRAARPLHDLETITTIGDDPLVSLPVPAI